MPLAHGSDAHFTLDNSGGTPTDVSAFVMEAGYTWDFATHDVTTFGDNSVERIVGLKDFSLTISGPFDTTMDAHLAGIYGTTTSKTFTFGPAGNTSGLPRYTGECFVSSFTTSSPVAGEVTYTATLEATGDTTRNTF